VRLIHTCYRVTDPERSVAFYEALGLEKRRELPIRDEATNIFMGVPGVELPELELTHNHGVDEYEMGTAYGHVALEVSDLDGVLRQLKEMGIEPERPPYSLDGVGGRLCFVRDPDDYRVELLEFA
jgi:lactoylglutathione lyase